MLAFCLILSIWVLVTITNIVNKENDYDTAILCTLFIGIGYFVYKTLLR